VADYLGRAVTGTGTGLPSPPVRRTVVDLSGRLAGYAEHMMVDVI